MIALDRRGRYESDVNVFDRREAFGSPIVSFEGSLFTSKGSLLSHCQKLTPTLKLFGLLLRNRNLKPLINSCATSIHSLLRLLNTEKTSRH